jgi:hypothetical protein
VEALLAAPAEVEPAEAAVEQALGKLYGYPEWYGLPQETRDRAWATLRELVRARYAAWAALAAGLRKSMEAATRRADRLAHGEDIESDGICSHQFDADRLRAEAERLRAQPAGDVLAALEAEASLYDIERYQPGSIDRIATEHARTALRMFARKLRHAGEPAPCGANVDDSGALLVCSKPRGHEGDHNTAEDGSGDAFPNRDEHAAVVAGLRAEVAAASCAVNEAYGDLLSEMADTPEYTEAVRANGGGLAVLHRGVRRLRAELAEARASAEAMAKIAEGWRALWGETVDGKVAAEEQRDAALEDCTISNREHAAARAEVEGQRSELASAWGQVDALKQERDAARAEGAREVLRKLQEAFAGLPATWVQDVGGYVIRRVIVREAIDEALDALGKETPDAP